MNYRKGMLAALLAPMITLGAGALSSVQAAGFAVFTQGASALGQGNAVTAHSDSPSTIFYNPALINRLSGTQLEIGTTLIHASREFSDSNPADHSSNSNDFFPSTFYITHKFNDSVSGGFGVFSPFGLGTNWSDDWTGRYIGTKSDMKSFDFNPVLSYQVTPAFSVAAGLDVIYVKATLKKEIASTALGVPGPEFDIESKFKGDGTGVGFNVAAAYDLGKDVTLGASYRSPVKVNITGDASFSALVPSTVGDTSITLPQQATAGIAYKGIDALTLEAGVRWEGWSSFDRLRISLGNGQVSDTVRDWRDTWGINVGGRYQINETAALLAGYIYGNSAATDHTFDPTIPDANTHIFCVGTDLKFQKVDVALSYAYQKYVNRDKNNGVGAGADPLLAPAATTANGKYETDGHLVALSMGYKF